MKNLIAFFFLLYLIGCKDSAENSVPLQTDTLQVNITYPLPATTDSLFTLLKTLPEDTNKVNVLIAISKKLVSNNPDTALLLCEQAFAIAEKISHSQDSAIAVKGKLGMANALGAQGVCYRGKGDFLKALDKNMSALKIDEELKDTGRIAMRLGNIGIVYDIQGNHPKALGYFFDALELDQKLGNKTGIERHLGNIGNVYSVEGDYPKALDYYRQALLLSEELKARTGIATHLGNIGNTYYEQAKNPALSEIEQKKLLSSALESYLKALKAREELKNKRMIAGTLGNIGNVYKTKAEFPGTDSHEKKLMNDTALIYYLRSLKMREDLGAKDMIAGSLGSIGVLNTNIGQYKVACDYLYRSLALADSIGAKNILKENYSSLSTLYEKSTVSLPDSVNGKILNTEQMRLRSIYYFKRYLTVRDTLFSEENKKQLVRKELNYEFDKKEAATKAENDKKEALAKEKLSQKETQRNYFIGGFALVLLLAGFIFRGYRQKQKANKIILHQKLLVEEKQTEILDSIHYAKRIQQSMMPTEKYIQKNINRLKNN